MKTGPEYLNSSSKRSFDLAATLSISPSAGFFASVGILAAASEYGFKDLFYRQLRLTGDGSTFEITKLRTLPPGSDMSAICHGTYDPRASKLASLIRRFGIDEIPQLGNILSGSMSLIGVRAQTEDSLNHFQMTAPNLFDDWYSSAYAVAKPALIGVGSLHNRGFIDRSPAIIREIMDTDLGYVDTASLTGDIKFLAALPFNLLFTRPASEMPHPTTT